MSHPPAWNAYKNCQIEFYFVLRCDINCFYYLWLANLCHLQGFKMPQQTGPGIKKWCHSVFRCYLILWHILSLFLVNLACYLRKLICQFNLAHVFLKSGSAKKTRRRDDKDERWTSNNNYREWFTNIYMLSEPGVIICACVNMPTLWKRDEGHADTSIPESRNPFRFCNFPCHTRFPLLDNGSVYKVGWTVLES